MQGQKVVKCQFSSQEGEYKNKTRGKEVVPGHCSRLVTSSRPQEMAQNSPYFIWDNPAAEESDRLQWEGETSRNEKGPGPGRGSDGGEGMEQGVNELHILNSPLLPLLKNKQMRPNET